MKRKKKRRPTGHLRSPTRGTRGNPRQMQKIMAKSMIPRREGKHDGGAVGLSAKDRGGYIKAVS